MKTALSRLWPPTVATVCAALITARLTEYRVPLELLFCTGLAVFAAVADLLAPLASRTRTYSCPTCPLTVQVTNVAATEEARLRELATDHTAHTTRS
ncbi:hypothetical protein [Streptomyces alkaliterrae]|uniref:Uncharacterized protein n=1 Tax=Streptomyces alkaliterrae TaxID=2213162 RepID=A0A5P0YPG4_9ACTN|nr:hypothetical protein [Streptomyces alkaliterrae]MBB1260395.1 hypothetical protein [Streptomyces alkaliterrae]MQS01312.1 hypothetical protein [Streptomyces alkaliterrae]